MDGRMEGWKDGRVDRRTDGQVNAQTDRAMAVPGLFFFCFFFLSFFIFSLFGAFFATPLVHGDVGSCSMPTLPPHLCNSFSRPLFLFRPSRLGQEYDVQRSHDERPFPFQALAPASTGGFDDGDAGACPMKKKIIWRPRQTMAFFELRDA